MDGRSEYRKIVDNLMGRLEYLRSSGISEIPIERGRTPEGVGGAQDPLEALSTVIAGCEACGLRRDGVSPVAGAGGPRPVVVFVGGFPTAEDEERKRPFSGSDGAQLEKIIAWMSTELGIEGEWAYLCLAVKCRPDDGRPPSDEEIGACKTLLERQIAALAPMVVVALGPIANASILGSPDVEGLRGRFHAFKGIKAMATHGPAELLERPELKRQTMEDMIQVMNEIKKGGQG